MKQCPKCKMQYEDAVIYCMNCGNPLETVVPQPQPNPPKKSVILPILLIVACVLLVISIVANLGLGIFAIKTNKDKNDYYADYLDAQGDFDELERDYEQLEGDYASLQSNYDQMEEERGFYNRNARIIPDDGANTYHKHGCEHCDLSSFYIHNINYITGNDLASPCPYCCADE